MQDPSHYAVLGLHPREFSPELLKKQYRALALRWHPDRNRGSEEAAAEKFKEIQGAPLLGACRLWPTGAFTAGDLPLSSPARHICSVFSSN